jgi:tripartite-type tricarboxylate transporter receptor subunit TctC
MFHPCSRDLSLIIFTAFAAAVSLSTLAAEPAYPTRPVRLLIPFAPGGGADALARIITPKFHELLGHAWVVDNRGGAAGNLAAETVARATPDGYTVFQGFNTVLTVNPTLYKLPFSMEKDLQPVTMLANAQYILVLHPSVQANTLKEFVALAKQKPGAFNYSSAGVGSPLHLAAELFKKQAGINMVHLSYKGGSPAAAAVLAGEAHLIFGSVAASLPQIKAGRLRALATTGARRSKVAPELPTMAESGFPNFNVTSWYALLAPAGTPPGIVRVIHDTAAKVLELPDVQQAMGRQGLEPETSTPQELGARIRKETALWATVIKDAGIKAD